MTPLYQETAIILLEIFFGSHKVAFPLLDHFYGGIFLILSTCFGLRSMAPSSSPGPTLRTFTVLSDLFADKLTFAEIEVGMISIHQEAF